MSLIACVLWKHVASGNSDIIKWLPEVIVDAIAKALKRHVFIKFITDIPMLRFVDVYGD